MEIKNYAPVRIHTLNRYEKFRACFESLEACTGAEKTEVFIGLDYPPSEKYVDGWKKIDVFLKEKEKKNSFKKLHVYRRTKNCGIGNPNSNASLLDKEIRKTFDRWISSEDDNIFSPNFLEYINKGLEKFKDDSSVYAICGYSHPYGFFYNNNNHFRHQTDMSAWGYGVLKERQLELEQFARKRLFWKLFSLRNLLKMKKFGYNRLLLFIDLSLSYKKNITDGMCSFYMQITDKYVIVPTISKVRNVGWDLEGNSFKKGMSEREKNRANYHNKQLIDQSATFEYIGDSWVDVDINNLIAVNKSDGKITLFNFLTQVMVIIPRRIIGNIYRSTICLYKSFSRRGRYK